MENYQKIYFKLQQDEDGYPPNDWESLWAIELEPGKFQIDNIPFFVHNISFGDVVSAFIQGDKLCFRGLLEPSAHSVIRIIVFDTSEVESLRSSLRNMGCSSELSHISQLFTVDIPPSVSIKSIRELLDAGERRGDWEYEDASIRHSS
jgi:hypothetical protein